VSETRSAVVPKGRRRPGWPRPRLGLGAIGVVAIAVLGGFAGVAQLRGTAQAHATLQTDSPEDLTRILASLNSGADALRDEISNLRLQLFSLQTSTQRDATARQAAQDRLRSLEVLSGAVPVFGPGVEARIDDPRGAVTYDLLVSAIEELRAAGAEALAVNGHRLGATSWVSASTGHLVVDGSTVSAPLLLDAIGDPATLDGGLRIPGGTVDNLGALPGVSITVRRQARLDLAAVERTPTFDVARPVGSSP
jgi:uncharacterized protein YlxW (UPF0749 family)